MKTIESRSFRYGVLTTAVLIAYFMIMKAFGLVHNFELRAFNAIIMFTGVFLSIRSYKKWKGNNFQFLKGAGVGIMTSLVVAVLFSIFVTAYVGLNPAFLTEIKQTEPQGIHLNEWAIAIIIFIEAAASGFLFTYMSMQWLKSPNMSDLEESGTDYSYSN